MLNKIRRYANWLHLQWPAGKVEKLPVVNADGSTNINGLYIVGDLTGIPLLKFAADSGARAVQSIAAKITSPNDTDKTLDLIIIGGGISGFAAALQAKKQGLSFVIYEAAEPFATIANFPRAKPIYTYPTEMTPAGVLQFDPQTTATKEALLVDLQTQIANAEIPTKPGTVEQVSRRNAQGLLEIKITDQPPVQARNVIVGIGRSGNYRKLNVPGENLEFISNRLLDPREFQSQNVLVIGGGDTALETTIALINQGANVSLSYRKPEFTRAKSENIAAIQAFAQHHDAMIDVEQPTSISDDPTAAQAASQPTPDLHCERCGYSLRGLDIKGECPECGRAFERNIGNLRILMHSSVTEFRSSQVVIQKQGSDETEVINADAVFTMIGREPPLDFFRRSGVPIRGEWRPSTWAALIVSILVCAFLYHWKSDAGFGFKNWWKGQHLFPFNLVDPVNPANLFGTLFISMREPSFYYTLAYTMCIGIFGYQRIKRRRTPYVRLQTHALFWIQTIPLFILPYLILPWLGYNGWFDDGVGKSIADALFPLTEWDNHGREYWRSVGFILAWPLLPWNFFTSTPLTAWLIIGSIQTFVLIPLLVYRYGKGAYCGWICSCGALAETLGDTQREKMPHGPIWNRLNFIGQFFLGFILLLFAFRILGWIAPPDSWLQKSADSIFMAGFYGRNINWGDLPFPMKLISYEWFVDLLFAGIFGVCFYFFFSGRVWCRFACPLAALMHIYARCSRFRIFADKKKCISCNVCTTVCHQGIDVMNFANQGAPMEDPQCVRCSACIQSCPTGVLTFGRFGSNGQQILDRLPASPVQITELTINAIPPDS